MKMGAASGGVTPWLSSGPGLFLVGGVIGGLAAALQYAGNPVNMGLCTAGFIRDIAGALGLHRTPNAQVLRPEILGLLLGSALSARSAGELKTRASHVGVLSVALGALTMLGVLAFHGCSMRAMLRTAGGDLTGPLGLAGFAMGVTMGVFLLRRGFSAGRSRQGPALASWLVLAVPVGLLALLLVGPRGGGLAWFGQTESTARQAAMPISLGAGLIIGCLAQRSRFCTMGAVRNLLLMRETSLLAGIVGTVVTALVVNLGLGQVNLSFQATTTEAAGGLLGMVLVGLASTLAGGCPTRQVILAGEGDGDAALFLLGMAGTAALAHNASLFSSCAERPMEASAATFALVILGLVAALAIGLGVRSSGREGR